MNPIVEVKNNINIGKIVAWLAAGIVVFAILNAANVTDWLIYPVDSFKTKFLKK